MNKRKQEPFEPFVTMEDLLAFDAKREETFTKSRLMNAVMKALQVEKLHSIGAIGHYLNLTSGQLSGAIEIITGMKFNELRDTWVKYNVERLKQEQPKWTIDQIARELGYSDRTVIWNLYHRKAHHNYYMEVRGYSRSRRR